MAEFKKDIVYIKENLDLNKQAHEQIVKKIDNLCLNFVTVEEFKPIKSIVYGMVGFVLLAFLTAIVALVIVKI